MVAHGGLGESQGLRQLTDARLLSCSCLDLAKQLQAGGVGNRLEQARQLLGALPAQRGTGESCRVTALTLPRPWRGQYHSGSSLDSHASSIAALPRVSPPGTIDIDPHRYGGLANVVEVPVLLAFFVEAEGVLMPDLAHPGGHSAVDHEGDHEGGPDEATPHMPSVLFVCVHNAGRSQMAAALLEQVAQGRIAVRSAGSDPAEHINPAVYDAMAEIGIDLSGREPKKLTLGAVRGADVVVTMGCGDACPAPPSGRLLDWSLPDPAGQSIEGVRPIRDEIHRRVKGLAEELLSSDQLL